MGLVNRKLWATWVWHHKGRYIIITMLPCRHPCIQMHVLCYMSVKQTPNKNAICLTRALKYLPSMRPETPKIPNDKKNKMLHKIDFLYLPQRISRILIKSDNIKTQF